MPVFGKMCFGDRLWFSHRIEKKFWDFKRESKGTEKVKKVDEIKAKYKGQPENKETAKKEIEPIRKTFRENVKSVLTAQQLETLKAKHKEKKAAGKPNALEQD